MKHRGNGYFLLIVFLFFSVTVNARTQARIQTHMMFFKESAIKHISNEVEKVTIVHVSASYGEEDHLEITADSIIKYPETICSTLNKGKYRCPTNEPIEYSNNHELFDLLPNIFLLGSNNFDPCYDDIPGNRAIICFTDRSCNIWTMKYPYPPEIETFADKVDQILSGKSDIVFKPISEKELNSDNK